MLSGLKCTPAYGPRFQAQQVSHRQPDGTGLKSKALIGALLLGELLLPGGQTPSMARLQMPTSDKANAKAITLPPPWSPKVRVIGASLLEEPADFDRKGGYYIQEMIKWMYAHPGKGFNDLQKDFLKKGYYVSPHVDGGWYQDACGHQDLGSMWQQDDPNKPLRFVIMVGQRVTYSPKDLRMAFIKGDKSYIKERDDFNEAVDQDLNNMTQMFRELFDVSPDNIIPVRDGNRENALGAVDVTRMMIEAARKKDPKRPIQLLYYYSGHGMADVPYDENLAKPEHVEGHFGIGMTETDLKKALNPLDVETLVVLDCCQAEAFQAYQELPDYKAKFLTMLPPIPPFNPFSIP